MIEQSSGHVMRLFANDIRQRNVSIWQSRDHVTAREQVDLIEIPNVNKVR